MASEQQVDLLINEIRDLVRKLGSADAGTKQRTDPGETKTARSFDELIKAIGLLSAKMEGKSRTAAQETRAMEQFAKQVNASVEREKKLEEAANARAAADREVASSARVRVERERQHVNRELKNTADSLQSSRLMSRQTVEQIRAHGVSFGDVLQNQVGDKLVKLGGGGIGAATALEATTIAGKTAAQALTTFGKSLIQGERGAALSAKAMTQLADGINNIATLISGVAAVAAFAIRMTPLGRAATLAISGLSMLAGVAAKTAAELNELASKQVQDLFDSFKELSRMGAAPLQGLGDLRKGLQEGFMTIGADLKDFTRLITSNAEDLKVFGNSLFEAGRQVIGIAGSIEKERGEFLNTVGIFREDLQQAALTYMSIQARTGRLQINNTDMLRKQTEKLAFEMDTLASLTGKQKEEIAKEMRARMAEERYRAALIEARNQAEAGDPEARQRLDRLEAFGRMADMLRSFGIDSRGVLQYAAGGPGASQEARAAMQQFRLTEFEQMAQGGAEVTQGQLIKFLQGAIKSSEQLRGVEKITGKIPTLTVDIVNVDDMMRVFARYDDAVQKGFKGTIDDYLNAVREGKVGDKELKDMIKGTRAQINATLILEQSLAEMMPAAKIHSAASTLFADFVTKFGVSVDKISGGIGKEGRESLAPKAAPRPVPIPTAQEAARDVERTEAELSSAKDARIAAEKTGNREAIMAAKTRELAASRAAARAKSVQSITPKTPAQTATDAAPAVKPDENLNELFIFGPESGSLESFNKLDPELRERLINAAKEYKKLSGGDRLKINSAYRTYEKQKKLYEEYEKRGKTGIPVANPDSQTGSMHMRDPAQAVDIGNHGAGYALLALTNSGLRQPMPRDDPMHFEKMADGGIMPARPGGSMVLAAEAGKNEAFVPLPDGKRIPVNFNTKSFVDAMKVKDIDLASETKETIQKTLNTYLADFKSYGGAMESIKNLGDGFNNMTDRLNTIIDILDSSKNIQNNLLQASHN